MKKSKITLILVVALTIFWAGTKLNPETPPLSEKQKKEALKNILGREAREEKKPLLGEETYQGTFFSVSYPAYAQVYQKENPNITENQRLLEYLRLDAPEPRFRWVALVEAADTAVLGEVSAVRSRRKNRLYQEAPLTIDGNNGVLFVKTEAGIERTSFFLKNGRSYSFSITGVDPLELEKIYGEIMDAVRF